MCGFVGFTGECPDKEETLKAMLDTIAHRGPDSGATYVDKSIALGFRRLSIIDLSTGDQPIYNEDRSKVLLFNGEIYNYQPLREELLTRGHRFTTRTDSEVLLHGYEEYGEKLLGKLRGMFSFIIWDSAAQKLFGARDFFGIKPFYYSPMPGSFFFGSEIKAFLPHPRFKKEFYEEKLPDYLTFGCVPGPETFFRNVYKLPPGHFLEYERGACTVTRYFTPTFAIDAEKPMDFFVGEIKRVFADSVVHHKISDVEVGCFLSGGVDSSYVTKEMAKVGPVKTYSIGFEDLKYDESADAAAFAREANLPNFPKKVSSEEYFANAGKVQYHLDEPLANPSANLLYFLSERAAEDVKVVLSGEGADEFFGGYNIYKEPLALRPYQLLPRVVRKVLAWLVGRLPDFTGKGYIIRGSKTVEERYFGINFVFGVEEREKLLARAYTARPPAAYTKPLYDEVRGLDDVTKMQYIDMHLWLVQEILLKADKMSMAHSLELRVPFLDAEVFRVVRRIPTKFKVSAENTKLAFREAARADMSNATAERKKQMFPLPLVEWMREKRYRALVEAEFEGNVAKKYFKTQELMRILDMHREGRRGSTSKVWTLYSFFLWYREFFILR